MHRYAFLTFALIAAITLGACSFGAAEPPTGATTEPAVATVQPNETTAEPDGGHVTITFGAISFMHHTYEPLIAAFNQQHPGITVQFVALDGVYQRGADDNAITREIVSRADTAEAPASAQQFEQ